MRLTWFVLTLCAAVPSAFAVTYTLPPEGSRLVGTPITITVPERNTLPLEAFAAQHGLGLSNMLEANPGVDPFFAQIRHPAVHSSAADFTRHRARGDCR